MREKMTLKKGRQLILGVILASLLMGTTAFAYMYPVSAVWSGGTKVETLEHKWNYAKGRLTVYSKTDPYEHHTTARVCVRLGTTYARSEYGNQGLYIDLSETKEFDGHRLGLAEQDFSSNAYWYDVK
ncbi:MAG: hypothetical protein IK018_03430 [Lachnospiraceae bacterium]|nr:hypothetical protein [Lachnospiraceae bacterium]